MKRSIILIAVCVVASLILVRIDWSLGKDDIVGTYVNTNYDKPHCCVEAPHEPDTLILKSDFTYFSDYYGKGTYELNGLNISWTYCIDSVEGYNVQMGEAGYSTHISNKLFEEPRIILNSLPQLEHYYRKIK